MPTHTIVPYKFSLRESGDPDNYWNLNELSNHDPSFAKDSIIQILENFFNKYYTNSEEDEGTEKTFRIEDYATASHVIEGIIRTGDYGYSSVLRNIDTDETTVKGMREAEELPFYFIFHLPQTARGEPYEYGQEGIFVFQTVNRRGVKSVFNRLFENEVIRPKENTVMEMNPVYVQDALDKIIDAHRILEAEFIYKDVPEYDDESRYHILEGLDNQETQSASMKLKADRGGSIESLRRVATRLRNSNTSSFAELVGDETEDIKVTIKKENGARRRFSVLEVDIKMRQELAFEPKDLDQGLPTSSAIARESRYLVNTVLPQEIVKRLDAETLLE